MVSSSPRRNPVTTPMVPPTLTEETGDDYEGIHRITRFSYGGGKGVDIYIMYYWAEDLDLSSDPPDRARYNIDCVLVGRRNKSSPCIL